MFIISELGIFVKGIVSLVGYLLFLPINLLDKLVFSKLFEGEFISTGISFAILIFLLFLILGITSRIFLLLLKFGILMLILYLLSDVLAGIFLVFILLHIIKECHPFKKKQHKKLIALILGTHGKVIAVDADSTNLSISHKNSEQK